MLDFTSDQDPLNKQTLLSFEKESVFVQFLYRANVKMSIAAVFPNKEVKKYLFKGLMTKRMIKNKAAQVTRISCLITIERLKIEIYFTMLIAKNVINSKILIINQQISLLNIILK